MTARMRQHHSTAETFFGTGRLDDNSPSQKRQPDLLNEQGTDINKRPRCTRIDTCPVDFTAYELPTKKRTKPDEGRMAATAQQVPCQKGEPGLQTPCCPVDRAGRGVAVRMPITHVR